MGQDVEDGRLVGGRYRLEGVLGRGGMGTVWRGRDETLGRTVAVKELRFPSSVDEDEKQRLITRTLREAKAIARIRSGSAITVFDVVDEDDRPWIVMELIEGRSLADQIRQDGPLDPKRVAEVGLSVLDVLRAAHHEGILHRDVKPSNVLLEDETGRVILTDFGIAKVEGDPSITSTGMLVGAPSYISPERARGKPPGPPADLWSLGGLLYAAVEGRPPYDKGSAISTLTAVMTEPLPPLERAGALSEVIFGLLEKDPDKRLDVAGARVLLEMALNSEETTGVQPGGMEATRVVAKPPPPAVPPAPPGQPGEGRGRDGASGAAASGTASGDRLRGALQSVRNAGAASGSGAVGAGGSAGPTQSASASGGYGPPSSGGSGRGGKPAFGDMVSRRKLAVVAAVVAVLVVLGIVLATAVSGGEDDKATDSQGQSGGDKKGEGSTGDKGADDGKDPAKPTDGADDKPTDGTDGAGDEQSEEDDDGGDDGSGKPGSPELPEGYEKVTDTRFHFSMAMPEGFERTGIAGSNSGGKYGRSGDSYPRVQIDFNGSPSADALMAWKGLEPAVKRSSPGYRKIFMKELNWRAYPTSADWGFERNENNRQVRVLNRGFKVNDKRGYAIMVTCEAGTWDDDECRELRQTAFKTFRPE
ncbi:serine/threonine protein kinase [Streptomyces sp. N2-109]|uniref:non-specific serine/threonine protein kinase n=1 Tax=Streptomyces gossypii TaxID=2883101 RepID=A0ABT2JWN9_9ACTN|nr:serine/threonine-protein kinase [Streptomyces gossypii]MCT2592318.1 serine/threonine protein kinase [Streptomyces gossypii]